MGSNIWDEFAATASGEYPDRFKFETPGDAIAGTIEHIRVTDFGGSAERSPELWITRDDGTQAAIVATQTRLRQLLAQERPNVGDKIAIVYTGDGERTKAGFNPPKQFDVKIKRGEPTQSPESDTPAPAVSADSLI